MEFEGYSDFLAGSTNLLIYLLLTNLFLHIVLV